METIGAMCAWGCQEWAPRAIKNHLKICDKILVAVAPHSVELQEYSDGTFSEIRNLRDDRVQMIDVNDITLRLNADETKCAILNRMLSYTEPGDVMMLCDADEFYDDKAAEEIKVETALDGWDMIRVYDMFFCINMDHWVGGSHGRFWKISPRSKFYPTQNMSPSPENIKTILQDSPMFHYSLLTNLDMRKTFWESEGRFMQVEWLEKVYKKWPLHGLECEIDEIVEDNYALTGNRGFWFNSSVESDEYYPYLFDYNGPHPEEIENSGLIDIRDFRERS